METTTRWHSCRLAPYGDSGRVRWCVGHERAWQTKLKFLLLITILLLCLTIVAILFSYIKILGEPDPTHIVKATKTNFGDNEIVENDERELLYDTKTAFVPSDTITLEANLEATIQTYPFTRLIREIRISTLLLKKRYNATDFDYPFIYNKTEDYEDIQYSESKVLSWSVSNTETKVTSQRMHTTKMEMDETPARLDKDGSNQEKEQAIIRGKVVTPDKVRRSQAAMMAQYMNNAINPCDDFYEYACGNWGKYNQIPPDKASYDTFEILRENLDEMLRDLLVEEDIEDEDFDIFVRDSNYFNERYNIVHNITTEPYRDRRLRNSKTPVTKAKLLYKSCMNEDLINRRAEKPLLKLLQKLGGWPILELEWDESNFDWLLLMAQLRLYNNDILISEWVGPDIKNSDEYVIQFDQTSLGLPTREYFLDQSNLKYLEAYRVYIITIANLLGASIISATQDVDEMIDFETELAKITATQDERRNVSEIYMKVTVGELQAIIPQIDWLRYLNIIIDTPIHANQSIVCFSAPYFQDLVNLLSFTPSRTIANYLLWRFVRHRVNNLDKRFQDAKQRFYYVLFGREKMPPRWQICVTQVNSNMGMALGKLFVQKYFDEKSKNDTLHMTREIKQAFGDILLETGWLDSNTKDLARLKIDAMKLRIGYPEFILDMDELADRYKDVEIHPNLYFENTLSILQHLSRSEQKRVFTSVNKTLWNTAPAVVNAYYSRNKNQIMFPAGILQPPFYQRHFPRCLNYGGIGVVIGHEITHGFDDKGRLFDKEGNLQRWWRQHSIEEFHDRAQCLIDQYNTYTVPEINMQVDGISTQGENIADNGGIKQAYKAYTKWLSKHSEADESLPGLNLTNKQLFFLNFAQVWCGISRPEAARNKLKTAVHSPGRFRVIGTLSNSEDFSEAYNCPPGSPMNPKEKCRIW